mmetsp:Transcript_43129/g.99363  ORF Transcript_43129/g.99363 Transcript_43129/m.99363 type:complete len:366 (-) Transcript_43129:38-1135(-)
MLPVRATGIEGLPPPPPVDTWRPPVASDEAVQVTHVDAALAKISCAQLGYFKDTWTETILRTTRPHQRSPLIHRGYYSRVVAMRNTVTSFLEKCPTGGVQIVNLGAGFDTLYFWLRDSSHWRDDLVYFEVDFPEVLSKKRSAYGKRQALWPMLDIASQEAFSDASCGGARGTKDLRTAHCRFVSTDMRIQQELAAALEEAGLQSNVPTLFIAECVLVYMQGLHGDSIIQWAASAVNAPSAMVVYEQTNPHDKFGKVMVENLMNRGCPLLSIHDYPSMPAQQVRYTERGWEHCNIEDMIKIYNVRLDRADLQRVHKLELLDEFEEWNLIQAHYFFLVATRTGGCAEGSWVHEICGAVNQTTPEKPE